MWDKYFLHLKFEPGYAVDATKQYNTQNSKLRRGLLVGKVCSDSYMNETNASEIPKELGKELQSQRQTKMSNVTLTNLFKIKEPSDLKATTTTLIVP